MVFSKFMLSLLENLKNFLAFFIDFMSSIFIIKNRKKN